MKRKASELDDGASWGAWSPSSEYSSLSNESPNRVQNGILPWARATQRLDFGASHINLRTMKRHRDSRPDAEVIHQTTLAKLFNAQRQLAVTQHEDVQNQHHEDDRTEITQTSQQNLHSFFNIGHSPAPRPNPLPSKPAVLEDRLMACEDCSTPLWNAGHSTGRSEQMDVDQLNDFEDFTCAICRRSICDMCAVRGDQRVCLECAMPGGG